MTQRAVTCQNVCKRAVTCQNVCKQCSLPVKNNIATFAYNKTPVLHTTIKLCLSTNPITTMFTTKLHACKQQHPQLTEMSFPYFSVYLKHPNKYVSET